MALSTANGLLASLASDEAALLAPHLVRVRLNPGNALTTPGAADGDCYFPESVVASCAELLDDKAPLYAGLIGAEGFVGWAAVLGGAAHDRGRIEIGAGTALRIGSAVLVEICRASPVVQARLLSFVHTYTIQMARTIAANLRSPVEQRLARWLLMLHDRVDGDEMEVTHDQLAEMLAVRRASVTDSLHVLEGHCAVRSTRGHLVVRDRACLEALAGECYGTAEAAYSRAIGPFGKTGRGCASRPVEACGER